MNNLPYMSSDEIEFLGDHLKSDDLIWEWGSGGSTLWLSSQVKHVTSVEHQPSWARELLQVIPRNVNLIVSTPQKIYVEGENDGDYETFNRYVDCFPAGWDPSLILIDGRARVACARRVSQLMPSSGIPVFLHDCEREEYREIWEKWLRPTKTVGRLMRLETT